MKTITITRTHRLPYATLGTIDDDGDPFAQTLELPWRDNQNNISDIPPGTYTGKRYSSAKYPDVWQLIGVQGRDVILLHWGNFDEDTHGCIIVGERFSRMKDRAGNIETGVADSKSQPNEGFNELMERTKLEAEIVVVIRDI